MIQLVSVTSPGSARTEFFYDGLNRLRITIDYVWNAGTNAWNESGQKRRIYDGMDVVQERNVSNQVTASVIRAGNIGGILARVTPYDGVTYFGYDLQGNVTTLTDATGNVVGSYAYDAWGNTVTSSGARAGENPYRFSTKEQLGGLYHFGYRFYDAGNGRWLNRDPLEENGGVNLYAMVGNNPVNFADPDGLTGVRIGSYRFFDDGHPFWEFNQSSKTNFLSDTKRGYYAGMDGLSPFGSPYKDMGYYSPCDLGADGAFKAGKLGQVTMVAVTIVRVSPFVTRSGGSLRWMRWVMRAGGPRALAKHAFIGGAANTAEGIWKSGGDPGTISSDFITGAAGSVASAGLGGGTSFGSSVGSGLIGGAVGGPILDIFTQGWSP